MILRTPLWSPWIFYFTYLTTQISCRSLWNPILGIGKSTHGFYLVLVCHNLCWSALLDWIHHFSWLWVCSFSLEGLKSSSNVWNHHCFGWSLVRFPSTWIFREILISQKRLSRVRSHVHCGCPHFGRNHSMLCYCCMATSIVSRRLLPLIVGWYSGPWGHDRANYTAVDFGFGIFINVLIVIVISCRMPHSSCADPKSNFITHHWPECKRPTHGQW